MQQTISADDIFRCIILVAGEGLIVNLSNVIENIFITLIPCLIEALGYPLQMSFVYTKKQYTMFNVFKYTIDLINSAINQEETVP